VISRMRRWPELLRCFRNPAVLLLLLSTTILIAINWFVYIYGVATDQIVQTSLGYFILPLVNVVLGMLFYHERLRWRQWLAVALASAGVLLQVLAAGEFPGVGLSVAFSFALYG